MTTSFIGHLLTGTHAARPAATAVPQGTLYSCTTDGLIYQSSGSAWSTYYGTLIPGGSISLSYGSNSTHVTQTSTAGSSNAVARADHAHAGIHEITASSSNTLQRNTVNFRAGTGISFGLTDADGQGTLDTLTINNIAAAGGGGGGDATHLESDRVQRTAGNLTTTSTTFVDATGMSITKTTGARRVLLSVSGTWNAAGSDGVSIDFTVDGTRVGQDNGLMQYNSTTPANVAMSYLTDVLSAGSHTFKVQWKSVSGGSATLFAVTTVTPLVFSAVELYAD
jgi:hypothetical protein